MNQSNYHKLNKLFIKFKNLLSKFKNRLNRNAIIDEDEYYENMFVKDGEWASYDTNEDESSRLEQFHIHFKKSYKKKNLSIADIGSGRGWLGNAFSIYGNVICIEPVKAVVNHGKKLYPHLNFYALKPNSFIKKNPNMKFDLIVCSEVLEHVIDKENFINDLFMLLKKSGIAIISTPRKELYEEWTKKNGMPPQPIEEWISTDECINLFEGNGFKHLMNTNAFDMNIYQIHSFKKIL